jgi:hypothetical protein
MTGIEQKGRVPMTASSRITRCKSYVSLLAMMIGPVLLLPQGIGLAAQKQSTVYNQCACLCVGPTGGAIIDISNTGGFSCGAYNSKTCNYEDPKTGGIRSGTTKYCGGYKPGGTKAAMSGSGSATTTAPTIMSRGTEPDSTVSADEKASAETAGEVQERAIPRMGTGLSAVSPSCSCRDGTGTCTVTTTETEAKCYKGKGTCSGTCKFMPGTGTGFTGGLMRQ